MKNINKTTSWQHIKDTAQRISLKGKNAWFLLTHSFGIILLYAALIFFVGGETPYSNFLGVIVHAYVYVVTFIFIRRQLWPDINIPVELGERKNMSVAVFFAALLIGLALIFTAL